MNEDRFGTVLRLLGTDRTRRGVIAALAGFGLAALPTLTGAGKKKRKASRAPKASSVQIAAASVPSNDLVLEGVSDADRIMVFASSTDPVLTPLWDHTDLTVTVRAAGNHDPAMVAALHQAVAIWSQALDRHFIGKITMTDITADHEANKADIFLRLTHNGNSKYSGLALCGDDECKHVLVKSEFPPSSVKETSAPLDFTPEVVGQIAVHELGHALGLGHAQPIYTTDDIMGYGFLPWVVADLHTPVLSTCDLKVLDAVFAWVAEGSEPRRPTVSEIVCHD
jgi:hypothetical protein